MITSPLSRLVLFFSGPMQTMSNKKKNEMITSQYHPNTEPLYWKSMTSPQSFDDAHLSEMQPNQIGRYVSWYGGLHN